MTQAGIHAAFGIQAIKLFSHKKGLYPAIIFGAILPDLDVVMLAIGFLFHPIHYAEQISHRSFSHSFFTIIFVYLFFALWGEWKKDLTLKFVGKGLGIGMLTHVVLDTFFRFRGIHFFWPLPIEPFNLWTNWVLPDWVHRGLLVMEFFCFRWYAWYLIQKHMQSPNQLSEIVHHLNSWKNIESTLFITFIIIGMWNPPIFLILFGAAYTPSLIFALWATFMSRHALDTI